MVTYIHAGERPSRPTDPSQTQWLDDSAWDVITASWRYEPEERCKPFVMHHAISKSNRHRRGVQGIKLGDLNTQNDASLTTAEYVPDTKVTGRQQLVKILPRVASFF